MPGNSDRSFKIRQQISPLKPYDVSLRIKIKFDFLGQTNYFCFALEKNYLIWNYMWCYNPKMNM